MNANLAKPSFPIAFGIPIIVVSSYAALAVTPDLRLAIPLVVTATAVIVVSLAAAAYCGAVEMPLWSPRTILFLAVAIRLPFLFRPPELSDDIYRYLWDGINTLAGHNPYSVAPAYGHPFDAASARILEQVNHPGLFTIYPPAAQIVFGAGAFIGGVIGMKSALFLLDIVACVLTLKILGRLRLPVSHAVMYAWHPLPVLEISSSGHIDGAAIFFLLLAFYALLSNARSVAPATRRADPAYFLAGVSFSAAVLVKLFPLVFLPSYLYMTAKGQRRRFIFGMTVGGALLVLPFGPDIANMLYSLKIYMRDWEFSGFLFQYLRGNIVSGAAARTLLATAFSVILLFLYRARRGALSGHDPSGAPLESLKSMHAIAFAFCLLTPTLHPWYALYLAFLIPFVPGAGGITLSCAVFLSYQVLILYTATGEWSENGLIPAVIWSSAIVAALAGRAGARLSATKSSYAAR